VTGDDDGEVIPAVGGGGGPDAFGVAQSAGHVEVADGLAEGDGSKFIPDLLLEGRALLVNRKVEDPSLSLEVLYQLFDALYDHGRDGALQLTRAVDGPVQVVYKADLADVGVRSAYPEKAQR